MGQSNITELIRVDEVAGGGNEAIAGRQVTVHYTGWLTDGTMFDSSRSNGTPAEFRLGQVIAGWNEGLALMKKGSRFKFHIPSALGYGEAGSPPVIPANATLIFDVELLEVTEPAAGAGAAPGGQ